MNLYAFSCNNDHFATERGVLYSAAMTVLIFFPPAADIKFFALPSNLQEISVSAFYKCNHLEHVLIPDNTVKTISIGAFEQCSNLRIINFPKCVTNIQANAFKGCTKLSCGLSIENIDVLKQQLIDAQLPRTCFESCIKTKCFSSLYSLNKISLLFVVIMI